MKKGDDKCRTCRYNAMLMGYNYHRCDYATLNWPRVAQGLPGRAMARAALRGIRADGSEEEAQAPAGQRADRKGHAD